MTAENIFFIHQKTALWSFRSMQWPLYSIETKLSVASHHMPALHEELKLYLLYPWEYINSLLKLQATRLLTFEISQIEIRQNLKRVTAWVRMQKTAEGWFSTCFKVDIQYFTLFIPLPMSDRAWRNQIEDKSWIIRRVKLQSNPLLRDTNNHELQLRPIVFKLLLKNFSQVTQYVIKPSTRSQHMPWVQLDWE